MAFLSASFFVFVAATGLALSLCPVRLRPRALLLASLAFYASRDPAGATLMLALTALAYWAGREIGASDETGRLLALVVSGLVGVLLFFKLAQAGFAGEEGGALGRLAMPLGLSYVIFKLVSYLVDVYWRRRPAERSFGNLTLYAVFFPQIVSGPIQRAGHFLDQVGGLRVEAAGIDRGLRLIAFGLGQKLVADHIGVVVSAVYRAPASFSSTDLLIALYAFAFQLYLDFAGITDIAIGLGALFGLETPPNFERPFFATSIQDFWRRWHMTLSSWLADYLFTPLWHRLRSWQNLGLTVAILANMLAIGLWHGAKWTFVIFGLLNGVQMTVSVLTRKRRNAFFKRHARLTGVRAVASRIVTFHSMAAFFVFVRADSLATATAFFKGLVTTPPFPASGMGASWAALGVSREGALALLGLVTVAEAIHWRRGTQLPSPLLPFGRGPAIAATLGFVAYMVLCRDSVGQEFLYAQF